MPVMAETAARRGEVPQLFDLIFEELDVVIVRLFIVSEAGVGCVPEEEKVVVDHKR